MLYLGGIPVICKTASEPLENMCALLNFAQQQSAIV